MEQELNLLVRLRLLTLPDSTELTLTETNQTEEYRVKAS